MSNLETENEVEDLYGDLDDSSSSAPPLKKLKTDNGSDDTSSSKPDLLRTEFSATRRRAKTSVLYDQKHVDKMQKQIDGLKEENHTLKRNIGTLYRTAKAELARREREIADLQDKIDKHEKQGEG